METQSLKTRKNAFSLVELLVSLIIISLIIAAFVPVMTKKFTQTIGLTTSRKFEEALLTYGSNKKNELMECETKENENFTTCKFIVPEGVSDIVAVLVGGGGGGASGAGAFVEKDIIASSDDLTTDELELEKTIVIEDGMQNVTIRDLIGGGGGSGAGFWHETESGKFIKNCPAKTLRIEGNNEAEFCVTQYNVRPTTIEQYHNSQSGVTPIKTGVFDLEIPMAPITFNFATGDTPTYYGDINNPTSTAPACWASPEYDCSSDGIYSGCGRTVCNFIAAYNMCKTLNLGGNTCNNTTNGTRGDDFNDSCTGRWRLNNGYGNTDDRGIIGKNYEKQNNSLSFCSAAGTPKCSAYSNSAYQAGYNYAYPSAFWHESYSGTQSWFGKIEDNQYKGAYVGSYLQAFSVRCVLQAKDRKRYLTANGTGGIPGTALVKASIQIPQEIIEENTGGTIKLIGGKGGKGGGHKSDSECKTNALCVGEIAADAQPGEYSYVLVLSKEGEIVWGYRVGGGIPGQKPYDPLNGIGAPTAYVKKDANGIPLRNETTGEWINDPDIKTNNTCEKYNETTKKWENVSCPSQKASYGGIGYAGIPGEVEDPSGMWLAGGAHGVVAGTQLWNYYMDLKYNYGSSALYGYGTDNEKNKGGDGISGWATIKYDRINSQGVAGGGGGGACVARIEKIPTKTGDIFNIQIGKGGDGGQSNDVGIIGENGKTARDGQDGGATVFEFPSQFKLTVLGGLKGKGGTNAKRDEIANGEESGIVNCTAVEDNVIPDSYKDKIVFLYTGTSGKAGTFDIKKENGEITKDSHAVGGNGGIAGFYQISGYTYTQGGCGGYSDIDECASNPNGYNYGLSAQAYDPFKLYSGKNYGTFGSGGGGGGWLYDIEKNERAGSGAKGLDGYVYLYWYR